MVPDIQLRLLDVGFPKLNITRRRVRDVTFLLPAGRVPDI